MAYEIRIKDNQETIEILNKKGSLLEVAIGDRNYKLDIVEVEKGVYSVLLDGDSFNIELIPVENKKYTVNTLYHSFDVDIIDAEARYMMSRKSAEDDDQSTISTPMPGKVVRILVEEGQKVKAGETVIVVSAMKMESEYKAANDKTVKQVLVKEGDNIDGNQPLVIFE
ncbi:MAG: biotin/lipoyl-binding protein [Chlorobi bacterium]|nr:biotin/lipoyl-binding protein [Chlorobiota bacterium]